MDWFDELKQRQVDITPHLRLFEWPKLYEYQFRRAWTFNSDNDTWALCYEPMASALRNTSSGAAWEMMMVRGLFGSVLRYHGDFPKLRPSPVKIFIWGLTTEEKWVLARIELTGQRFKYGITPFEGTIAIEFSTPALICKAAEVGADDLYRELGKRFMEKVQQEIVNPFWRAGRIAAESGEFNSKDMSTFLKVKKPKGSATPQLSKA